MYVWVEDKNVSWENADSRHRWLWGSAVTKSKESSCRWKDTRVKERRLYIFLCRKVWRMRSGYCKVGGRFLWEPSPWIDETWNPEYKRRDCLQQNRGLSSLVAGRKVQVVVGGLLLPPSSSWSKETVALGTSHLMNQTAVWAERSKPCGRAAVGGILL